ncbi:MAG TPA: hypothetical protein VGE16_13295, partial [Albitalea sp.]
AWRLAHLLAVEDGPAGVLAAARNALRRRGRGAGLDCFHCASLWVAAPLSLWVATRPLDAPIVWLALSGAACLGERIGSPDVVLQPLPETQTGEQHELLRTKT